MTIMDDTVIKTAKLRSARIKAAKAAKKLPTALLLQKKVECDAKALTIVERLIEPQVKEEWMLENLGQINRSHLEDVIEERAISKLCGYILCDNPLTKVVKKQYKISTLRNKIYDVQKTKNFCSFWCYSATEYLLEQMLTSPLWLRREEEIPDFLTFDKPKDKMENPPGVEVNIVGLVIPSDTNENITKKGDIRSPEAADEMNTINEEIDDHSMKDEKSSPENSNESQEIILNKLKTPENDEKETKIESKSNNSLISDIVERKIATSEELSDKYQESRKTRKSEFTKNTERIKKLKQRPSVSVTSLTARVEQSLTEWITKHTIDLLYGDKSTKQRLLETLTMQEKYGALCKKLNTIQLEESKEDRVSAIQSTVLQPPPHFSVLRDEAEALEVKVRAFYQGNTVIEPKASKEKYNEEEEPDQVVPLTSAHAPIALRRRIFLDKLNKVLPDLLRTLSGPGQYQYSYTPDKIAKVKALVNTFKLSATNIVFKTAEWTLVAFLIIKILSIIDINIKNLLSTKQAAIYMSMILMSYQLDSGYLDRLISSLTMLKEDNDDYFLDL